MNDPIERHAPRFLDPDHGMFEVSVKAIIVDRVRLDRARILMMQRRSDAGDLFWDAPGGRIKAGESFEDALKREVAEETGFTSAFEVAIIEAHQWNGSKVGSKIILYYLVMFDRPQEDPTLSSEHVGFRWIWPEDIMFGGGDRAFDGARLEPDLRRVLDLAIQRHGDPVINPEIPEARR